MSNDAVFVNGQIANGDAVEQAEACLAIGDLESAIEILEKLVSIEPTNLRAWHRIAQACVEAGNHVAACQFFLHALSLGVDGPLLGDCAEFFKRHPAAQDFSIVEKVVNGFCSLGSQSEALEFLNSVPPEIQNPEYFCLLSEVSHQLGKTSEAITSIDKAISAVPNNARYLFVKGKFFAETWHIDEAVQAFSLAASIDPCFSEAHWNEAVFRLLSGDLALGFSKFEWRRRVFPSLWPIPPSLPADREWNGSQSLIGQRMVLFAEQGLGDTIQFARYVPILFQAGASAVSAVVPSCLRRLLSTVPGLHVCSEGEEVQGDFYCSLMSLPACTKTALDTIPSSVPYLFPDPREVALWRARIDGGELSSVGVVWSGNPTHRADHQRSIPLATICETFEFPFTALHVSLSEEERRLLEENPRISFVGNELHDMAATAALVSALDLVITVDTAVAHLAGALNKPVWLLLHEHPDWRWLLHRETSPWYPSARLIRMQENESWPDVLLRLTNEAGIDSGPLSGKYFP